MKSEEGYFENEIYNSKKLEEEINELFNKDIFIDVGDYGKEKTEYIDQLSDYEKKRKEFVDNFQKFGHDFDPKRDSKQFHETKEEFQEIEKEAKKQEEFVRGG